MEKRLTAIALKKAPNGKLEDGGGLRLVKSGSRGKWVYRYSYLGKRREMGLGTWPALSLAAARSVRDQWSSVLVSGRDPITFRRQEQDAEKAKRDQFDPIFADMMETVFQARQATLRGGGRRGRWKSPLDTHVIPVIGQKRISLLDRLDIKEALSPIWKTKHPTAIKAYERTRIVLREADAMGYQCDPSIVDKAVRMLGAVNHKVQHIAATPWRDIPELYARLDPTRSTGLCLRWMMLTLVRSDGCRRALLPEVDDDLWTVPADRIKAKEKQAEEFRVPLSTEAQSIVRLMHDCPGGLMFPGQRGNAPISDRALEKALDGLGELGRPHGFRTSFRTWAQDTDACSYEVAEAVLGHKFGSKVQRSYARSDLLDRRRSVLEAWARHVTGAAANGIKITR